jgi:cytochrome P450
MNCLSLITHSRLPSWAQKACRRAPVSLLQHFHRLSLTSFAVWDGRSIGNPNGPKLDGALISSRDLKRHAPVRKAWSAAFVPAAIKGYEPMLIQRVTQLVDALGEQTGRSVDLSGWFSFFS